MVVVVVEMGGGGGDGWSWWWLMPWVVVVEMGGGGTPGGGRGRVGCRYVAYVNFELTDKITPEYIRLYIFTLIGRHPSRNIADYST